MSVNSLFFCLISLLLPQSLAACCMGDYVGVYPRKGGIAQNPVFLVEYQEHDFKLAEKLPVLEFYLLVNNREEAPVLVAEKLTGIGSISQLLLKPARALQIGDSVKMQIRWKFAGPYPENEKLVSFERQLKWAAWKVALPQDQEPPKWTGEVSWVYNSYEMNMTSVSGHSIQFTYQVTDNYQENFVPAPGQKDTYQLLLVEVAGQKIYCIGEYRNSIFLSTGACGSNFPLQVNQDYVASITPLDFSGNPAAEKKSIRFNTFPPIKR